MYEENGIDLIKLAKALWKNILIIALVALLCGSAAFGYTIATLKPTYKATVSLYVNKNTASLGDGNISLPTADLSSSTSSSLVNIYLYILKSRTTMEEVIQEAGLSYTPGALSSMISTKTVSGTAAFEVTVTSANPAETELIANTIAKVLPVRISEIVNGTSVQVVDYAIIPTSRSGPNLLQNTQIGILAGAVLSAGVVILLTLLKDNAQMVVQSADELRGIFPDIMVLGSIPDMRYSDKRNGYYSKYYGKTDSGRKGGKKHG